ncbi:MAG TPA: hypothetical protein VH877_31525 [Polyangia bacterium]|jgi:hypothetical protein|nr:hypothetical protein [Polyangia bacterium]
MRTTSALFLALLPAFGCGPTSGDGIEAVDTGSSALVGSYALSGATNVAIGGTRAYVARGSSLGVLDLTTGSTVSYTVRTHDVAVSGNYVYTLDAVAPGASPDFSNQGGSGSLNVINFTTPTSPAYAASALSTNVGPFSGVAVAGSRFIVSGGTGLLRTGTFTGSALTSSYTRDLGLGQPDVTISADGAQAYVSTDFDGTNYGVTVLNAGTGATLDRIVLASGSSVLNTPGSATPANFGVESAVVPSRNFILTASINGVAAIDLTRLDNNISTSPVLRTVSASTLGVTPINVDVYGTTAYVVGSSPSARLVWFNVDTFQVLGSKAISGTPRAVAVDANNIVVANVTGVQVLSRTAP